MTQIERQEVKQQAVKTRIQDFFEVALGLTPDQARLEASRCLQCKNAPCVTSCPVEIDIPAFIKLISEGNTQEALAKIKEKNNLPAICGRVCPQEDQCEGACVLNKKKTPINIGALERYASDCGKPQSRSRCEPKARMGDRVAVVGSGPAGLTAAADLARLGLDVVLYESLHEAGGVLAYGIPEFRLPKAILREELDYIRSLGVDIQNNVLIGCSLTIADLFDQGFRAVFLALGAGLPQFLGIPGENVAGVYSANEFLTRINLMKSYQFPDYITPIQVGERVVVVGAGNVAFDCARAALRLKKCVTLVYRRTEAEMPARIDEIENAKAEGIKFQLLTQPQKIELNDEGKPSAMTCIRMQLGEPDASGRRRPVPIADSEFDITADTIIEAIGQRPNPLLLNATPLLRVTTKGTLWVDEQMMTSMSGVYAGGDIVTGAATVISAMGAGKRAARAIEHFLKK